MGKNKFAKKANKLQLKAKKLKMKRRSFHNDEMGTLKGRNPNY